VSCCFTVMQTDRDRAAIWLCVRNESRCETLSVRGLTYNIRRWGREGAQPLMLLHGTQDSSITFQFVVDCLKSDWDIFAPDWRGHGYSDWASGGYWFHDFVADLDDLRAQLFPDRAIPTVGHSLGGNIAAVYAGLRPKRVSHVVSLDGFGPLVNAVPAEIKTVLRMSLDAAERGRRHSGYATVSGAAERLMQANPRLQRAQALFLATHSTRLGRDANRRWLFDPVHQRTIPTLRSLDEWFSIWADVEAPVCWLASTDQRPNAPTNFPEVMEQRAAAMRVGRRLTLPSTGHNVHHDAPDAVAAAIEEFIG
jgi:pimeloyl-ACP methyl ester carboxylesterase